MEVNGFISTLGADRCRRFPSSSTMSMAFTQQSRVAEMAVFKAEVATITAKHTVELVDRSPAVLSSAECLALRGETGQHRQRSGGRKQNFQQVDEGRLTPRKIKRRDVLQYDSSCSHDELHTNTTNLCSANLATVFLFPGRLLSSPLSCACRSSQRQ